jgi:hypothetical protein
MKTSLKKMFYGVLFIVALSPLSYGQPGKHHDHAKDLQELSIYAGKLFSFSANPDKIYDAFQMNLNGATTFVKFPKHLGKQLMTAAKPGTAVTVSGFTEYGPEGTQEIHMVSLTAGTTVIYDVHTTKEVPFTEEFVTIESAVSDFKNNREGKMDGIFLSDNTILHLPKHSAYQLASLLKKNDHIKATGYVKKEPEGVAYAGQVRIVRAETIMVNGNSYLLR